MVNHLLQKIKQTVQKMAHTDVETFGRTIRWSLVAINTLVLVISKIYFTLNRVVLWSIRHAECPIIYLLGWRSRHHSPRSMDAYWQIIYRNTTAEQSLHVSSIYHDCCWKHINNIIVYRFSRRDKGISIYTSYLKYYFYC